ncbi:MAG TPA: molecular chaperone TorD family protein [Candidatus Sulfomarinibacteraceae bacterium]|nr:molecular chaperone TorD family protein [Candidatus Sulfomarinibacteraceae bacterium]
MNKQNAIRRAQVYGFLAEAFLYPRENWSEDIELVVDIVRALGWIQVKVEIAPVPLPALRAAYRNTFGAAGSLGYETEYGLPHEYRQSQEMADIAGFYRAFGLNVGGEVRERADHVAVELEFMHVLALKEAYALETGSAEHVDICTDAQGKFLQDHLGRWIDLLAESVAHNAPGSLYAALAQFAAAFVHADAERLGVTLDPPDLSDIQHTPYDADFSCADCAAAGLGQQGFIRADTIH